MPRAELHWRGDFLYAETPGDKSRWSGIGWISSSLQYPQFIRIGFYGHRVWSKTIPHVEHVFEDEDEARATIVQVFRENEDDRLVDETERYLR